MKFPTLTRRSALQGIAGTAALAAIARPAAGAEASAPAGRIRHSVCKWCYKDIPLETFCAAAKEMGIESVELLGPDDFPVLRKHGLHNAMVGNPTGKTPQGVTVGGINKGWNRVEHHDTLVALYEGQIPKVADGGFQNLICFSGNREKMDDQQGLENCAKGLKRIVGLAERRGVTLVMELLNSKVNHKDYMCDHTAWGVELCKRVGSPNFKLLYDIYHMQIMEGDVIRTLRESAPFIAHYHTGGNPGRNEFEPQDEQELNYPAIMRAIKATGYRGFVGQEFLPKRDPLTSLRAAVKLCSV